MFSPLFDYCFCRNKSSLNSTHQHRTCVKEPEHLVMQDLNDAGENSISRTSRGTKLLTLFFTTTVMILLMLKLQDKNILNWFGGKNKKMCKTKWIFFNKGADLSVCLSLNWQACCLTPHWPGFPLVPYLFEKWMDFWELADCTAVSRKAKWNCAVPLQGNSHVHRDWHFLLISFSFPACGCKIWESLYKGLFSFLQPHHFLDAKWKLNLNWKVKLQ